MAAHSNRVQGHWTEESESGSMFGQCAEVAQQTIEDYPLGVTLGAFAAGLGLGAMIGAALAQPIAQRRQASAEHIGRRILDSISDLLPASVQRQLHF
ncbi:MAG: hypothetical protein KF774_16125 [Planctomyces sp.]|nr:hypothetical protein [Planctomyces sp.]